MKNPILWKKIQSFELDDPKATFPFSVRLSKENMWDYGYTLRCMHEYKKFMYLACTAGKPVCPSDEIDQVWHLHLLYTQSYWIAFCKNCIEQEIHHGPTKGGAKEIIKHDEMYLFTLDNYKKEFGQEAPKDIWPEKSKRFAPKQWVRFNKNAFYIIPKKIIPWKK